MSLVHLLKKNSGMVVSISILMAVALLLGACSSTPAPQESSPSKTSAPPSTSGAPSAPPSSKPAAEATKGGQLVVGLFYESPSYDPNVARHKSVPIVTNSVFETLILRAPDGSLKGHLATSWQQSSDGLSYTFKLRQGVKFHDGTPFNADAVKFNLDRIVDPATKSLWAVTLIPGFKSAEVVDDLTVRLNLKSASATFLDNLSGSWFGMTSPSAVKKYGADFERQLVGTGPFRLKERVDKDHITVERNPEYNWPSPLAKNKAAAYLDSIEFKFITESGTRVGTLTTGETHFATEVPVQDTIRLQKDGKFQVFSLPMRGTSTFLPINAGKEPTDSLEVRQAILYAADVDTIVKNVYGGLAKRAFSPLTSVTFGYDKGVEGMYSYNPDKARALLDQAGWKPGSSGIREKNGKALKLLYVNYNNPEQVQAVELLQAQLKQVGIEMEFKIVAPLAYIEAANKGEHNVTGISLSGTDPSVINPLFHQKGANNWTKHSLTSLNSLLEEGIATLDEAKRKAIYADIQQQIAKNALALPIAEPVQNLIAREEVQGLDFSVEGYPQFYGAFLKK